MDLFTLAAKLSLDSSDFEKGISKAEKQGSSLASKLGGGIAKAGKFAAASLAAGVSAATAAITSLTKSAVEQYANYEQLVGGVETLFGTGGRSLKEFQEAAGITAKSTQKQIDEVSRSYIKHQEAQQLVMENAREAYRTAGVDMNTYMQTATSFSAALISGLNGDTKKAAQITDMAVVDMADNANKMGSSLESIQNAYQGFAKQNYTMLDNLKLGYGGTKTEMQRLLKDASALAGKKFNLNNLADVYEAIHVIQTELGITGTTSKEAATTIQGSIGMMKAAWTNLQIAIADPNGNIGDAIQDMVSSAKVAFRNLMPAIRQTISGIATAVKELAPVIGKELPAIIGELAPQVWEIFKGFVSGVWEGLSSALGEVDWPTWDEVKAAAGAAWETIKNGATKLAGLVFGTKADGSVAWPTWDDVKAAAATAWNAIKAGAASIADTLGGLVFGRNADGTVAWPTWEDVKAAASIAWQAIKDGAASIADTLGGLVFGRAEDGTVAWPDPNKLLEDFGTWWDETAKPALEGAMVWTLQLFGMPKEGAEELASVIGGWWDTMVDAAQSVLSWALNLPGAPYDAGTQLHDIIQGWWDSVKAAAQGLLQWVLGIPDMEDENGVSMKKKIKDWWDNKIKPSLVGILSFTLGLFGLPSVQKMKDEIKRWWAEVKEAVGNLVLTITTKINPLKVSTGNDAVDELTGQVDPGKALTNMLTNPVETNPLRRLFNHNAKGLNYVPFDNYPTLLHRGEQILSASQARHLNDNSMDLSALIPAIVGAVREGMQDVTVRSYLSGRDITDDVSKNTMRALRARRFAT